MPNKPPTTRPIASLDTGYKMVGPVVLGLFIGYYLDRYFNTQPWCMLGLTFFGLATGFWSILRPLYFSRPEASEASSSADEPR